MKYVRFFLFSLALMFIANNVFAIQSQVVYKAKVNAINHSFHDSTPPLTNLINELSFRSDTGKNQVVAAVLAYFFGNLGVHNFYLGYKEKAKKQLLLSVGGSIASLLGGLGATIFGNVAVAGNDTALIFLIISIGLTLLGFVMMITATIWGLIDLIKIITGDLKPANGDYAGPDWF